MKLVNCFTYNNQRTKSKYISNFPPYSDGQEQNVMSVKDKIRAFETRNQQPDVRLRETATPKRKKPMSKAFEDFEREGILIGYVSNATF